MITLYGSPRSSAGRCFWCLEEVGAAYTAKTIDFKEMEHKSANFLAINPNGKVPALTDGDLTLFESMAINYYLCEKYKPELMGRTVEEKARVHQWSFWSISEFQGPLIEILIQKVFVPEERRSQKIIDDNMKLLPDLLSVLNNSLQNTKYIAGDNFTVGDINTASVASIVAMTGINLETTYPHINNWLKAIGDRPSFVKYQSMR